MFRIGDGYILKILEMYKKINIWKKKNVYQKLNLEKETLIKFHDYYIFTQNVHIFLIFIY